jgi:beta-galactosidase
MGVNFFRWDTATFGAEEYWHGMLNHDRSKSPAFDEMVQTVKELKSLGEEFLYSDYQSEIALYFDYDSSWANKIQPGHHALHYTEQAMTWYGALSAGHFGIDIVGPGSDLSRYKAVFGPLMYVVSEAQAGRIREYVHGGGLFVTGFRLGVKTETSQIVTKPLPGFLADVMGVTVEDYVPIYADNPHLRFSSVLSGAEAECGIWADILKTSGAEVLGTYSSGQHAGKPAITTNSFGKGKAVYIGADLHPPDLARVLLTLSATAGIKAEVSAPQGVELTVRKSGKKRWILALNHKAEAQTISLPAPVKDAITGKTYSAPIELPAYGVLVVEVT